jgi:ribose transport system substrate-binding protein
MKRKMILIPLIALVTLASACSTSNQKPAQGEASKNTNQGSAGSVASEFKLPGPFKKKLPLKIAFVPVAMNTYYNLVLDGVKEEIDRDGGDKFAKLDVLAPPNQDKALEGQIGILESLLAQNDLDVLCISTENDGEMIPYLKKFAEKGVTIFMFNQPAGSSDNKYYISNVGYDFNEAPKLMAEWAVKHFGDKPVNMLFLEGIAGTHNTIRKNAFMNVIKDHPNFKVVASQSAGWTREGGQSVSENMLTSNPNINFIFSVYDEMSLGAMVAVKAANKQNDVVVGGYDLTEDGYNSIKKGEMAASVTTNPKEMGENLIKTVADYNVSGKQVEKQVFTNLKVYDKDNINEYDPNNFKYMKQEQVNFK